VPCEMEMRSQRASAVEAKGVPVARAVVALELLCRDRADGQSWIETGSIADALGASVADTAACLRSARRMGLCARRRSLLHGTVWKLAAAGG
jgi:hypothetical protein